MSNGPIRREDLGNTPTIVTKDKMVEFCNDVLGVQITKTRMRNGCEKRELPVWKIQGVNATSEQALYDWIMGMAIPPIK